MPLSYSTFCPMWFRLYGAFLFGAPQYTCLSANYNARLRLSARSNARLRLSAKNELDFQVDFGYTYETEYICLQVEDSENRRR